MKYFTTLLVLVSLIYTLTGADMNTKLTNLQKSVLFDKNTEAPFSGKYDNFYESGVYTCANCNSDLYRSNDKFKSGCGWPSFDDEIEGRVKRVPDADGHRVEIICASCEGHLGHVFEGEGLTNKNIRHCVNSASMSFRKSSEKRAYLGGGCFWGVEYYLEQLNGVSSVKSGYMGGFIDNPTYEDICTGTSGHKEVVEVIFDTTKISYKEVVKKFFEIHDPTQVNGQGPDIGTQYLSVIFYKDDNEKNDINELISILETKGFKVATTLEQSDKFWEAEDYHQNYYNKKGSTPYCHAPVDRFK